MEIYQNLGIIDEKELRSGTVGLPFRIESAKVVPAYNGGDSLSLGLRAHIRNEICDYTLGDEVQQNFMSRMNVSRVEELVGKNIFGFSNRRLSNLQGIAPIY